MTLKERVHENLGNALENQGRAFFTENTPWAIAIDLCTYAADMEGYDPGALEPHIRSFIEEHVE